MRFSIKHSGGRRIFPIALLIAFLALGTGLYGYNAKTAFPSLVPGVVYSGSIEVDPDKTSYQTLTLEVPEDAFGVRLRLADASVDLDIYMKLGGEIETYSETDHSGVTDDWNEVLFVTRFSDPPLEAGTYYIDIAYQLTDPPVIDGAAAERIPFSLECEVLIAKPAVQVIPGHAASITLSPGNGFFSVAAVDVPEGTAAFRVDLSDTNLDVDFWLATGKPPICRKDALYVADSLLGRESFVVTGESLHGVEAGTYYISVFDQMGDDSPDNVSIHVTLGTDPPDELLGIEPFPYPRDRLEEALLATVEVIADSGKGSGCLISPDGYVLTNYHVIRGDDGNPAPHVAVGMSTSFDLPPRESFSASAVVWDEKKDLALLKIDSGLYGQNLPYQYRFPYMRIGKGMDLAIGQPVGLIGYPGIGGARSRVSLTYTQGVVSGFERTPDVLYIKTDGIIHDGSSGGAAINSYSELVGIPTMVVGNGSGQIGYITSVDSIPAEWFRIFKRNP